MGDLEGPGDAPHSQPTSALSLPPGSLQEPLSMLEGPCDLDQEDLGEASSPSSPPSKSWEAWYPTWEVWQFQRTLTYWISVMYLEGSILFLVGASFSLLDWVAEDIKYERALVSGPYFVGGIAFTVGSYLGVLEVANLKSDGIRRFGWPCDRQWRRIRRRVGWRAFVGYAAYTFGACLYNVNTVACFFPLSPLGRRALLAAPAVGGGAAFTFGSLLECNANSVWQCRGFSTSWLLSVSNLLGSLGFLAAGVVDACGLDEETTRLWEGGLYVAGSAFFILGSLCTMWLWKCEQYGLGFVPEMNTGPRKAEPDPFELVLNMHSEYGCGRASPWQLPFLTMYLTNSAASVLLIGIALYWPKTHNGFNWSYSVFEASLNFALSHGVMLLGSVVHHVPTKRPHSWLLVYMRIVLALYTVNSWVTVLQESVWRDEAAVAAAAASRSA